MAPPIKFINFVFTFVFPIIYCVIASEDIDKTNGPPIFKPVNVIVKPHSSAGQRNPIRYSNEWKYLYHVTAPHNEKTKTNVYDPENIFVAPDNSGIKKIVSLKKSRLSLNDINSELALSNLGSSTEPPPHEQVAKMARFIVANSGKTTII